MVYQGRTALPHAATPGHNIGAIDPSKAPRLNALLTVGGASKQMGSHMNSPSNVSVTVLVCTLSVGGPVFGCGFVDFKFGFCRIKKKANEKVMPKDATLI